MSEAMNYSYVSAKIEQLDKEVSRLHARLFLYARNQSGNPPPEIQEKLVAAGLEQESLGHFTVPGEGTTTHVSVRTYTTYDAAEQNLTRKQITEILQNSGWFEAGPDQRGKWNSPDGRHKDLKLREAYLAYHQDRGEFPEPKPTTHTLTVEPLDEQQWKEAVENGENCVQLQLPNGTGCGHAGRPIFGYGRIVEVDLTE